MDLACQVSWANLYPPEAVVPIDEPTQPEAWDMLSGLWRSGSHKDEFIFGGYKDDGTKYVWTAGRKIAKDWNILDHKKGDCYLGIKRGDATRVIDIDLDRHTAAVSSRDHLRMVLDTLRWLQQHMPWAAPHVTNVNPRNGSCHITLYLPFAIPVSMATAVVADIRSACPWLANTEIYPDNVCQFILPLRRDKTTVIDKVLTPSVKSWRKVDPPGQKREKGWKRRKVRREYLAMDAAGYWTWIVDEDRKPCDLGLVEAELRKAYRNMDDEAVAPKNEPKGKPAGRKEKHEAARPAAVHTEEGGIRFKNRCARVLVDFLRGGDGDARPMSAVMLRVFSNVEDMERDRAVALTGDLLGMRPDFKSKPVGDRPRLSRMIEAGADAIWKDNGYQRDPLGSLEIWGKVKAAWNRRGFRLSDPSTWDRAGQTVAADDGRDIAWSSWVLGLVPGLAQEARCDVDRARTLLRLACLHVHDRYELSLSFLARLMDQAGIKAYRNNVVRVRKFLEASGVIALRRRGFKFHADGGVGNHYTLALSVEVAHPGHGLVLLCPAGEEGEDKGTSTYPSSGRMDVGPLVERKRLERCLEHYYRRARAVGGGSRQAA
jgi:hypothetical protein